MTTRRMWLAAAAVAFGALLVARAVARRNPSPVPARHSPLSADRPPPASDAGAARLASPPVAADDLEGDRPTLAGQLLDSDEEPVEGARVFLAGAPPRMTTSGEDGLFSFERVLPGTHVLSARRGGEIGGPVHHTVGLVDETVILRLAADASPAPWEIGARAPALPADGVALTVHVKAGRDGTDGWSQLFLFSGDVDPANGKELVALVRGAGDRVRFEPPRPGTTRLARVAPGDYSMCALLFPEDPRRPAVARRFRVRAARLPVTCWPHTVSAAPREQTYAVESTPADPVE